MGGGLRRLREVVSRATSLVTPTGRALAVLGWISLLVGESAGIAELRIFGWLAVVLVALAIPWLLVPASVRGHVQLHPPRAVAGEAVSLRLRATHEWGLPVWQPLVRVGGLVDEQWLRLPTLTSGSVVTREVDLGTSDRGVHEIGRVEHHLTDPLGLLRLPRTWVKPVELYVRPRMIALDTLGGGQVSDLEGTPSDRISMSDLAFHALREYVRGDDLRHVHWRSSARAGQLLVRQYQDTRRNHVTVVLDLAESSYTTSSGDEAREGFELAASIAASLVSTAALESQVVSFVAGDELHLGAGAGEALDALCRVEPQSARDISSTALADDMGKAVTLVPDTSLLLVVTGRNVDPATVAAGLWVTPPDVAGVVMRAVPEADPGIQLMLGRHVLTVGDLTQLPGLMRALG